MVHFPSRSGDEKYDLGLRPFMGLRIRIYAVFMRQYLKREGLSLIFGVSFVFKGVLRVFYKLISTVYLKVFK